MSAERISWSHRHSDLPGEPIGGRSGLMSREDFERARSGLETTTPDRRLPDPPKLALPDPKPSYAEPARHAAELWFDAPEPSLDRDAFRALRQGFSQSIGPNRPR